MEDLKKFIESWEEKEVHEKNRNEEVFVTLFTNYIKGITDPRDVTYDGLNYQEGRQIRVRKNSAYDLRFDNPFLEIVYSKNHIKVYTARHNGFWVPEYLHLKSGDDLFPKVKLVIKDFLINIFGIDEL